MKAIQLNHIIHIGNHNKVFESVRFLLSDKLSKMEGFVKVVLPYLSNSGGLKSGLKIALVYLTNAVIEATKQNLFGPDLNLASILLFMKAYLVENARVAVAILKLISIKSF